MDIYKLIKIRDKTNFIYKRPDNPEKGLFDKSGKKPKKSIISLPYKLEIDEKIEEKLEKYLEHKVKEVILIN